MYLQQFLTGQVNYPYVYTDLDPTQNHIIDKADVLALLSCYSFVIVLEDYPDFVPGTHGTNNTVYSSGNKTYKKFNAQTGTLIQQYTLYSPQSTATSLNSIGGNIIPEQNRVVIGNDERVPDYTRTGAIKLIYQRDANSPEQFASGCIIDAHTIITAAHVVYTQRKGSRLIIQLRLFDANGNRIIKTPNNPNDGDDFTPVEYHVPDAFIQGDGNYANNEYCNDGTDYAIITVEEDLSDYTNYSLGFALNELFQSNTSLGITGFPVKVNNQTVNSITVDNRYYGSGILCSPPNDAPSNTSSIMFPHTIDTSDANSGSPLHFTYPDGSETQIGVHVRQSLDYTRNYATRINVDILHFCYDNPYASY
jgi:hypothetical protein